MLRSDPSKEYFLLEDHPLNKVVYTFILEIDKNNRMLQGRNRGDAENGYNTHINSARNRPKAGAQIKGIILASEGLHISFINNLMASAKGCGIPEILTLLGPFRS